MNKTGLSNACENLGVPLTSDQLEAFDSFENDLYEANRTKNLTRVPREECWVRHFLDALLPQGLFPRNATLLDIGTGPGFPAWPLACARPDLQVTGLDSNGKMLAFLRTHLLPNLHAVFARAEEYNARERFDVVTGRAVAPLSAQLEISAAFAKRGGLVILMRTDKDRPEIERFEPSVLGLRLREVEEGLLPLDPEPAVRLFPVYEKIAATPARFPRRWAEILKSPLGM